MSRVNLKLLLTSLVPLIILAIITSYTRFNNLNSIPANLNPDSADTIHTFLQLTYQQHIPIFSFNWNGASAFNTYLIGLSWALLGKSFFGIRFASAFISIITVLLFYIFGLVISKKNILCFVLALSLAVNPTFLNFSRNGWENIFNALFILITVIGCFLYFTTHRRTLGIILMSIGSILGFYGYHPGKFFIIGLVLIFLIFLIRKPEKKELTLDLTILLITFFLFSVPQIIISLQEPSQAFGRISSVSVFNQPHPVTEIWTNIIHTIEGFLFFYGRVFTGYLNARYLPPYYPFINYCFLPFFLIGIVISFKKYGYLLILFLITLLPPEVFSLNAPNAARGVHILPLIYLYILLGFMYIYNHIKDSYKRIFIACSILIILLACHSDYTKFIHWQNSPSTLNARQPAVSVKDYPFWRKKLECEIKNGNGGFTVGEWNLFTNSEKHGAC